MAAKNTNLGPVEAGKVYPVEVVKQLLGMKAWAWRKTLQRGLRVKQLGRRRYVTGDEVLRFFSQAEPEDQCA